jgi:hypothetical protein
MLGFLINELQNWLITWLLISPDLTPLDFHVGNMRREISASSYLRDRIHAAATTITADMLQLILGVLYG